MKITGQGLNLKIVTPIIICSLSISSGQNINLRLARERAPSWNLYHLANRIDYDLQVAEQIEYLSTNRQDDPCDCGARTSSEIEQIARQFKLAESVFTGRLIDARSIYKNDSINGRINPILTSRSYKFSVLNLYKGTPDVKELFLQTDIGGKNCGYHFFLGEEYLVYAYANDKGHESILYTDHCKRTKPFTKVSKTELTQLKKMAKNLKKRLKK